MSPTLRSVVVLLLWLVCPAAVWGQMEPLPLQSPVTLQPLLDAALANNRTLKISLEQIAKADADLTAFSPADGLQRLEIDLASAQARAVKQRPELREAELKVQQAQQGVEAKRAERIPDIGLTVRFLGLHNIEVLPSTVTAAGLQMTWNPFDWRRKRSEISASERVRSQAELSLAETQSQVRLDCR